MIKMTNKNRFMLGLLLLILPITVVSLLGVFQWDVSYTSDLVRNVIFAIVLSLIFLGIFLVCLSFYLYRKKRNFIIQSSLYEKEAQLRKFNENQKKLKEERKNK